MLLTKKERSGLQTLISDTVLLLCKNGLGNKLSGNVTVHGLIGVSINDEDLLLVDIRDSVQADTEHAPQPRSDLKRKSPCDDSGECSVVSVTFVDEACVSAGQSCQESGPSSVGLPPRKRRAVSGENNNGTEKTGQRCCTVERRASESYIAQSRSPAPIDLTFSKSRRRTTSQTSTCSSQSEPVNSPGSLSNVLVIEPISPGQGANTQRCAPPPIYTPPARSRRRRQHSLLNDEQINSEVRSHLLNIKSKLQQHDGHTDVVKRGSSGDSVNRNQYNRYISVRHDNYLAHAEEKVQGHIQAIKDKLHMQEPAQGHSSPQRLVTSPVSHTGSQSADRHTKAGEKAVDSSVKSHLENLVGHLKDSAQGHVDGTQTVELNKGQVLQGDPEVIQPLGVMPIGTVRVIEDKSQDEEYCDTTHHSQRGHVKHIKHTDRETQGGNITHVEQKSDNSDNTGNCDGNDEHSDHNPETSVAAK